MQVNEEASGLTFGMAWVQVFGTAKLYSGAQEMGLRAVNKRSLKGPTMLRRVPGRFRKQTQMLAYEADRNKWGGVAVTDDRMQ